jgi:hypothetical protein
MAGNPRERRNNSLVAAAATNARSRPCSAHSRDGERIAKKKVGNGIMVFKAKSWLNRTKTALLASDAHCRASTKALV